MLRIAMILIDYGLLFVYAFGRVSYSRGGPRINEKLTKSYSDLIFDSLLIRFLVGSYLDPSIEFVGRNGEH